MTLSLSDVHEQWMNLLKDSALDEDYLTLSVVRTLGAFLSPDSSPTPRNAVSLLWEYDQDFPLYESTSRLSAQAKRGLLHCLDWMHEKYCVPYEPDSDDSDKLIDLAIELHVGAARAFRIKQADDGQSSEEFIKSLSTIERTMKRIKIALNATEGQSHIGNPTIATSAEAIWAIVQLELSHVSKSYGNYADAIHYLNLASSSYISALDDCLDDPLRDDGTWRREDNAWVKALKSANIAVDDESIAWKIAINHKLTPLHMPLAEAASLFTSLRHSPPDDLDWKQVSQDCAGLAYLPQLEWEVFSGVENQETIEDHEGFDVSWSEFWIQAQAWASAQLSPSEYRKMRDQDEKDSAENRLRNYFFGSSWPSLPKRAQEALITADSNWNSPQRIRQGSILNELLRASEEMCDQFIWQPLICEGTTSLDILAIEAKVAESRHRSSLGVREHIEICKLKSLPRVLEDRKLSAYDIKFLTKNLPTALRQLADARNTSEHEIGASVSRDTLASFFNSFLGIGQPGILPELARIGRKLQTSTN